MQMEHAVQRGLIARSGLFDAHWYLKTYPEVARAGLDPLRHFTDLGGAMGRDPGPGFSTRHYLTSCPAAAQSGLNPVVHFLRHGQERGIAPLPLPDAALARLDLLRGCLLTLGFNGKPLAELARIAAQGAPGAQVRAAHELAQWHMRDKSPSGYRKALVYLETARSGTADLKLLGALLTLELLCLHHLGEGTAARAAFRRGALAGALSADALLVHGNFHTTAQARLATINTALARFAIPPLALTDGPAPSAYDRLTMAAPATPVTDGPLVSVLVAAYDAAETLPATLRSLQEQSWQNLDIIVLDDCSPTDATLQVARSFAQADPRIRVIRMPQNAGAYVARNHGLDLARGTFVTLQDADDWAHPLRIETQMRYLEANPQVIGCTTEQARARDDLSFTRWTGEGVVIFTNTSSFLFRRAPVHETLGYWDTVRFAADNELIRRIQRLFGAGAVVHLPSGPLAFQRDSDSSIIADPYLGINGFPFGARKAYQDAQAYHHAYADTLRYDGDPGPRPFPVPALMRPGRRAGPRYLPVVMASDYRMLGGSVQSCLEEIRFCKERGLPLGLVEMFRYDLFEQDLKTHMLDEVRALIDGDTIQHLTYGEDIRCDLLILRYPPVLQHRQRYLPRIDAREIRVIVNQPPMSDYSAKGVERYTLARCAANIRHQFGKDALWHPIGPLVREALHRHHADQLAHIRLSDEDWHNIIDLRGWASPPRARSPDAPLRIGRHSRDHAHKWPATRDDILAAYPADRDVEVHVLGGATAPAAVLGALPSNWVVHPFGALHPRAFLVSIDVFIYFAHPDWVESFGRTIIEAMATGRPVILPEMYRPLFEDAALYATPQTALAMARRLMADPVALAAQTTRAQDFVSRRFSHDTHAARLRALGISVQ